MVCRLTGLPTSDFSLFYYLPILTSAEFLPLRYIPFVFLSVYTAFAAMLYQFYSAGNGWDLLIIGIMRGGFLVSVSVLSVVLTRLQSVQNRRLVRQNTQITKLLAFHRQTGDLLAVKAILDLTVTTARTAPLVSEAGFWLKNPDSVEFDSAAPAAGALYAPIRDAVKNLVDEWSGSNQPKHVRIGDQELIAIPLRTFNTFRGVLFALGIRTARFPSETEDFLSSLAEIAGMGIARAKAVTLFQEIARAPFSASANDALIDWLLRHLTDDLGLDFAAVSAVDSFQKTIRMIRVRNVEPGWSERTNYPLDDKDMLPDIVRNAEAIGAAAAEYVAGYDRRFDEETYELYGHSKLARIFAPLLDQDKVVGVLETGCSIDREKHIRSLFPYVVGLAKTMGGAVSTILPNEFLAGVAQRAMEIVGAHSATIHIYSDLEVTGEASAGLATGLDFVSRFPPHRAGIGAAARDTGEVVVLDSPEELRRGHPELYDIGVRAMAAFPLRLTDRREGVLYLHFFKEPHRLSQTEVAVVKSVVELVEGAIINRQFLDEIAESAKWGWLVAGQHPVVQSLVEHPDLTVVLSDLVQKLRWMFGANSVVLYCYDQSEDSFPEVVDRGVSTRVSKNPDRNTAPYRLLRDWGETQFFQDIAKAWAGPVPNGFVAREGIQSCAAVVLRANRASEIVGVMFVNYCKKHEFSYDTRQAINSLGASAAIAIGTARLHDRANRVLAGSIREARALHEVDDLITESLQNPKRDEVLTLILEHSIRITGASDGVLYLLQPDDLLLKPMYTHGFAGVEVGPQKLGEGILGQAAYGRRPIRVPDVQENKDYVEIKADTRSELAVPLLDRDEVLGVINLEHTKERFFNQDHQDWIETLAMQGVIAIRSLESFQMLEAPLRAIGAVTGRIQRNTFDLNTTLRLVLTGITAKQGLAFTRAMLFSLDEEVVAGILAVGPADGVEAEDDWKNLEQFEEKLAGRNFLQELLDRAEQHEREIAAGHPMKRFDARTRKVGLQFGSAGTPNGLARAGPEVVERNKPHPARALLSEVVTPDDSSEEFAVVPLRETDEKVVGFLIADRAYQRKARPVRNVDLKNLEAFGELASFALRMKGYAAS
ncbi:hypothetical protein SBA4_1600002 [Candidatus Sulfopaludibacter sp. SbA4]|nr:hypothetical protein SBA4_1600002 [Candidatus Sulfopaludibacter sp. SbA4]